MDGGTGYGAFRDSEQDLEAMRRYEAFLQLQMDAEGLTDEEYLARLDRISGGDPSELLHGAEAYGSEDADKMAEDAAVRDASELADKYGYESADGIMAGMLPEDGIEKTDAPGARMDGAYENPEGGDPEADGIYVNGEGYEAEANAEAAGPEDASGDGAMPGVIPVEDAAVRAGAEEEDEKEEAYEAPEYVPPRPAVEDDVPSGPVMVPDEEDIPGKGQPGPAGRFHAVHEYHVDDVLDSVALGTGTLAGAVVGYDYIPAQPPAYQPVQQKQMTPALAAMYREMQRTDERERERQMDGPSR